MEFNSTSFNVTPGLVPGPGEINLLHAIPVGSVLVLMIIATALGNALVVTSVIRERQLHTLANKLVASLAVTDLMVAVLDLPLAASAVVIGHWPFGPAVCDYFITLDVLLCTNSILHLVAIAIDRYWTVTDITYTRGNKKQRYFLPVIVFTSWFLSLAVCLPSIFGWKTERGQADRTCIINQNKVYTVYSTVAAFYLPLLIIIIIYTKIFLVVRQRVRKKQFKAAAVHSCPANGHTANSHSANGHLIDKDRRSSYKYTEETTRQFDSEHSNTSSDNYSVNGSTGVVPSMMTAPHDTVVVTHDNSSNGSAIKTVLKRAKNGRRKRQSSSKFRRKEEARKRKLAQKRERKALRTLLLITGVFVMCWLPFFILAITGPFCGDWCEKRIPKIVYDLVGWLGYCNSLLNPIIYTTFSPDFRAAFRKTLFRCGK